MQTIRTKQWCVAHRTEDGRLVQYTEWSTVETTHTAIVGFVRRSTGKDYRVWTRWVVYTAPKEVAL